MSWSDVEYNVVQQRKECFQDVLRDVCPQNSLKRSDFISQKEKQRNRLALRISPQMQDKIKSLCAQIGCPSQNEFIEQAIQFYIGYLQSQDATAYFSKTLIPIIEAIVINASSKTNTALFRMAVEISMMAHAVAYTTAPTEDDLKLLRKTCINAVKNLHGPVSFEDANTMQNGERSCPS